MLLTISTVHRPATDLGYLLHKNPNRLQTFSLSFGNARVFYPEAAEEKCTAGRRADEVQFGKKIKAETSEEVLEKSLSLKALPSSNFGFKGCAGKARRRCRLRRRETSMPFA